MNRREMCAWGGTFLLTLVFALGAAALIPGGSVSRADTAKKKKKRLDRAYTAHLTGTETRAQGQAVFHIGYERTKPKKKGAEYPIVVRYRIVVTHVAGVLAATVRGAGEEVVLYRDPTGSFSGNGVLVEGTLTGDEADLLHLALRSHGVVLVEARSGDIGGTVR